MNQGLLRDIEYDEMVAAIDNVKLGKVAGSDEVVLEFLKFGGETVARASTRLFGVIWETNKMAAEWEYNIIISIHKKGN